MVTNTTYALVVSLAVSSFLCQMLHCIAVGFQIILIKKLIIKNRNYGPKKRGPLFNPNHVLATTGKSCSKKKSAFAQIIKGENVILGDFLG